MSYFFMTFYKGGYFTMTSYEVWGSIKLENAVQRFKEKQNEN